MTRTAAILFMLSFCGCLAAQTLMADSPAEVERARQKAEKAWRAWQSHGDVETRIFQLPPDKALAEIRKDGALADTYLTARQQQVTLLGAMFRQHAEELTASGAGRPDLGRVREAEERNLTALLESRLSLRDATAAAEHDSDPARRAARRQAVQVEQEYYQRLESDARDRLELLARGERSQAEFDRNERALIDTLNRLADTLDGQAAAFADERQRWEKYREDLARLVAPSSEDGPERLRGQTVSKKPAGSK